MQAHHTGAVTENTENSTGRRKIMSYKIFGDSCLDLTEELKKDPRFEMIPLTLQVDDHMIMDDETFDQKAFLAMVKASPNCPKTACPSPGGI